MKKNIIIRSLILIGVIAISFKVSIDFQKLRGEYWSLNSYTALAQRVELLPQQEEKQTRLLKNTILFLMKRNIEYINGSYLRWIFSNSKVRKDCFAKAGELVKKYDPQYFGP